MKFAPIESRRTVCPQPRRFLDRIDIELEHHRAELRSERRWRIVSAIVLAMAVGSLVFGFAAIAISKLF